MERKNAQAAPMLNAYPDSVGSRLGDMVRFLQKPELRGVFQSFYVLPSLFNTDLDRGFSVVDYSLSDEYASREDLKQLEELGIRTIGDLARSDPALIRSHLKKHGETIWNYANGIYSRPVEPEHADSKCYGNETTLPKDVTDMEEAKTILLALSESVAARLRADHVTAACITVKYTDCHFRNQSHQRTLVSSTNVTEEIYQTAVSLLAQLWQTKVPLRLLGVSASRISDGGMYQYNLFDGEKYEKLGRLDTAIDSIRSRYGKGAVRRGRLLPAPSKEEGADPDSH